MKYIYPINIDAILAEGTVSATTFTASNALAGEYYANDQNIEFGVTGWHVGDALRFDFTNNVTPDSVAIYVGTGAAGITARIWRSSDGSALTSVTIISAGDLTDTGWYIKTFTGVAAQYYIIEFEGTIGSFSPHEIFFSKTFDFPYNYNVGNSFRKIHDGIDFLGNAQAGGSVTNKRHGSHWGRTWNWSNFSGTDTDKFETFDEAVGGTRAKFLWYDGSSYHWVKQAMPMNYTEETYDSHSLPSGLIQQLY